jgi:hypothetical protein
MRLVYLYQLGFRSYGPQKQNKKFNKIIFFKEHFIEYKQEEKTWRNDAFRIIYYTMVENILSKKIYNYKRG